MDEESREPGTSPAQPGQPDTVPPADVPAPRAGDAAGTEPADQGEQGEQAEVERLRAEVRDLRGRVAAGQEPARRAKGHWRAPLAALLITLGCILAPVSVAGVWAANQVSNTDRYVANMAPLIREPAIQSALSARITKEITSRLDTPSLISQASAQLAGANLPRLSQLLQTFSGQIVSGVNSLISATVSRAVASPAMASLWVTVNRTAHAGIVKVLSGQGNGSLSVVNDQVVLNLGPLIAQVKDTLVARGLTVAERIPTVNATFPLFQAPNLAKAQQGYRLITTLRWVLPLLTLVLLGAGIWVSRNHRRGLLGAALGLAASMLVLGIALTVARGIYLNSVPSTMNHEAAGVLYDTLIRFVRQALRVLLVVGLIVAAGAFLTGPSGAAVATRRGVRNGIGWLRERGEERGLHAGPVGAWTAAHKTLLRTGAVAVVALIFVFWGQPTLAVVIWLVAALLALLGVIELLGGRPRAAAAEGTDAPPPGNP